MHEAPCVQTAGLRVSAALGTLTIRPMVEHETLVTARLWQDSQRAAYSWFREDQRHPFDEALAFFRESICARCEVWVAADRERILGMLALEGPYVDHLFVGAEHWERGVGSALLEHAKGMFPDGLTLVTLQRNERALRFYEARGFASTRFGVSPPPESEPDVYYEWRPQRGRCRRNDR
jgi:GNAT superfamily N-acetyltransferase